jgi:uncharacterized phage protein (predicted DNA packaging)
VNTLNFKDISLNELKDHLKIDGNEEDVLINSYLNLAKKYVLSYTGLTEEQASLKDDLTFAVLALAGDFYENRINSVTVQNRENPIVKSILSMHSVNYL